MTRKKVQKVVRVDQLKEGVTVKYLIKRQDHFLDFLSGHRSVAPSGFATKEKATKVMHKRRQKCGTQFPNLE